MEPRMVICIWLSLTSVIYSADGYNSNPCQEASRDAVLNYAYHCVHDLVDSFRNRGGNSFPSNFYALKGWNQTCSGLALLPGCIEDVTKSFTCTEHQRTALYQAALEFVNSEWESASFYLTPGACYGPLYNSNVSQLYLTPSMACSQLVTDTIDMCVEDWLNERATNPVFNPSDPAIRRLALEIYKCGVGRSPPKCGPAGQKLAKFILDQVFPPQIRNSLSMGEIIHGATNVIDTQPFLKAGRYSVGVYGDPHMLTYGSYQLQTCEINGLRDFIVNKFFRISAISDYVRPGQRGTSLTQVKISFYDADGEISTEYIAQSGELPAFFTNDQSEGLMAGNAEVTLEVLEKQKRIRIRVVNLALVMYLTVWNGHYYSLTLRAAHAMYRQSSGLLVDGCSEQDWIDVYSAQSRWPRDTLPEQCRSACSSINDTRRYSYSATCIYDCMTLESAEISQMTYGFQESMLSVKQDDYSLPLLPEALESSRSSSLSAQSLLFCLIYLILLFLY